jgi:hypothetical protein
MHKKAYLSSISSSSNSISGPPSTLSLLINSSEVLLKASRVQLPISAAFHAGHLIRPTDEKVLGTSAFLDTYFVQEDVNFISTSLAANYTARSLRQVLSQVIDDCLQLPIYFSKMTETLIGSIGKGGIRVAAMGPRGISQTLHRKLLSAGIQVQEIEEPSVVIETQLRGGSGDIAIVGMSGRFPGGESLEEFWNTIEIGCDVHKPVSRFLVV